MSKNQTNRKKILSLVKCSKANLSLAKLTLVAMSMIAGALASVHAQAQSASAGSCRELFRNSNLGITRTLDQGNTDAFFSQAASFSTAGKLATALNADLLKRYALDFYDAKVIAQDRMVMHVIAPTLWSYARTKTGGWDSASDRAERQRPRVMTPDEREIVQITGNFAQVDRGPGRAKAPVLNLAERYDYERPHVMMAGEKEFLRDHVGGGFGHVDRILTPSRNTPSAFTAAQIDAVLSHPVEFAVLYYHMNGLRVRVVASSSGTQAINSTLRRDLVKQIPAVASISPALRSNLAPVLAETQRLTEAQHFSRSIQERLQADQAVLMVLQRNFAPELDGLLEVIPEN